MKILGISAFYHDSAAAIFCDGEIIAAAQEERFSRKKHDASFPTAAIRFCLGYASCSLHDIDAVVFYDKPFLKFERLLETYYANAPKGLKSFVTAMPLWIKEKLFLKRIIYRELKTIEKVDRKKTKLLFSTHHLSHAASAFYPSRYQTAAILTIDAVGEWATASICFGEDNKITLLKELDFPHSVGLLYSAFTYYCGFTVNSGEYKLMGLAPYGNPEDEQTKQFIHIIKNTLADIRLDGSLFLNQQYFDYATGLRMANDREWQKLFGIPRREENAPINQSYCNLAFAIQSVTEDIVIAMATEAKRITQSRVLCLAGGVALNCVANGKLRELDIFDHIFIQPAAGDAGGALGAALAAAHIHFGLPRTPVENMDALKGSLLGTEFSDEEATVMANHHGGVFRFFESEKELLDKTALLLSQGNVIGWHQGRMEFGPRALGCRSILADARNPDMQKKLNLKIKFRESFRPFAPAMLPEEALAHFGLAEPSPYMLLVKKLRPSERKELPPGYAGWSPAEKLDFKRSDLPAITHIDYSARIQTVHTLTNPRFANLLQAFRELTGCGVLVNTSFNVRDEPIVNTPDEAYRCFMNTGMDYLVIGNLLFEKNRQPPWPVTESYKNIPQENS
jgi:carbamoyltransferase